MVQATVVLLPVLEEGGDGMDVAVRVLEEMVITQRRHVRPALLRMPPLPSVAQLREVNGVLAEEQRLEGPQQQLQVRRVFELFREGHM